MSKKINVAIVGLGFGAGFIPIYQKHPNAVMYAICLHNQDPLNDSRHEIASCVRHTADYDRLEEPHVCSRPIDAPRPHRRAQTITAAEAGPHPPRTLPMATPVQQCQQSAALVKPK